MVSKRRSDSSAGASATSWAVTIARVGRREPEAEVPNRDVWPLFAEQLSNEFMTVMARDSNVRNWLADAGGEWVLMAVGSIESPADAGISDLEASSARLKALMVRAVDDWIGGSRPGTAEGLVVCEKRPFSRQISARVVVLADRESALRYGERMVGGIDGVETGESAGGRDGSTATVARIKSLLDAPTPANYEEVRADLLRLSDMTRHEVAQRLTPALNEHAAKMPHATYEEKKKLATWVNAELRRFGLAVRSPDGRPCLLKGNPGGQPGVGRFVFDFTDAAGRRHQPFSSVVLPRLELTLDDLTRAPYGARQRHRER